LIENVDDAVDGSEEGNMQSFRKVTIELNFEGE
jgi:hypothetical protein